MTKNAKLQLTTNRTWGRASLGSSFDTYSVLLLLAIPCFDQIFLYFMLLQVAKLPQVVQQQAAVANIQQMVSVSQQVGFVLVKYSTRNTILLKAHLFGMCLFFTVYVAQAVFLKYIASYLL